MKLSIKVVLCLILGLVFTFSSCKNNENSDNEIEYISDFKHKPGIEVIQFHMEHRCKTCLAIEEVTKKALAPYGDIDFRLINIELVDNDAMARSFRVAGTAVFIYDPATGLKKELTDFAFMNAFDEAKYIAGFQKEIDQF